MARTFRLLPAGIEEAQFKKVPEGWLFTTVNPWFFAPRRTYLVNDAEKAPIAARVRRTRYIRLMLLVPALALLAATFVMVPADIRSSTTWLILGAFTVVLPVAMAVSEHLALRPLLRDMPRSSQKIGSLEMLQRQGQAMSVTVLVMVTLLFAISAVAYTYLAFAAARGNLLQVPLAAVFAAFAIASAGMLVAKLHARRLHAEPEFTLEHLAAQLDGMRLRWNLTMAAIGILAGIAGIAGLLALLLHESGTVSGPAALSARILLLQDASGKPRWEGSANSLGSYLGLSDDKGVLRWAVTVDHDGAHIRTYDANGKQVPIRN
jgi:hypothetical protein